MGIWSRLTGREAKDNEQRILTDSAAIPKNSDGYGSEAGVFVNERTALQSATVLACVQLLADSIASLPLDAYRKQDGIRVEVSPTPSLIARTHADLSNFEWVQQNVISLALRGNSYNLVLARDVLERPVDLLPLHPDCVAVRPDKKTGKPIYTVEGIEIPTADMVHIRRHTLPGCLTGLSVIDQQRQGIGLGLAAERYGARWFGQSADPSAVLETEENLDDAQVTQNQQAWINSHGGKRHPAMLSGGLKYRRISITPEESQFLETRKFQRGEIAMLFRIPPHMIGDTEKSTSWGTGIEQQSIGFVRFTLLPWLTCIEAALSDLLPRGQFVKFNADALLRGDAKAQAEAFLAGRQGGWLNADEIRSKLDLPPIPGGAGQDYLQPLNFGPLGSDPLANTGGSEGDNNA